MIPFRGDQFDRFNQGSNSHRPMMFNPPQHNQVMQPPSMPPPTFMFTGPTSNHHQPMLPQQNHVYIPHRPRMQQTWILSNPRPPPNVPMTTFLGPPSNQFTHITSNTFMNGQTAFCGGTNMSQPPYNGPPLPPPPMPPPSIGNGTGIPQPPFCGGTALLKRKSHYLDECDDQLNYDNDAPPFMNLPNIPFSHVRLPQNQPMFHLNNNPRFIDHNSINHRVPPPPPPPPLPPPPPIPSENMFNHPITANPWINNSRTIYTQNRPQIDGAQQQMATTQLFQKHQSVPIDNLLKEPGRSQRSSQILIVLRGLPGSGKSYVAELIRNQEEQQSKGTNKPKILSIDDYFLTENQSETKDPRTGKITKTTKMEYEYDRKMEETYRRSLIKLVRKSIDDRFFPFLIVDQNNEQIGHFRDFVEYAEANKFHVYFIELKSDVEVCTKRNVHKRTREDIDEIEKRWESLPLHCEILDIRALLQSDAIDEVEMDESTDEINVEKTSVEKDVEQEEESQITKKSRWETMMDTDLDRLDGVFQRRTNSPETVEKRLTNSTISTREETNSTTNPENVQSKKKRVRWADIEENTIRLHKKAVGFVVGQSEQDWQRMSDDYDPTQKLNQYKYI